MINFNILEVYLWDQGILAVLVYLVHLVIQFHLKKENYVYNYLHRFPEKENLVIIMIISDFAMHLS